MTQEEARKFAWAAEQMASAPEVKEFYRLALSALPQPSNEPLTLEKLRGMDGEAVFIVAAGYEPLGMWALIEVVEESVWLTNSLGGRTEYASNAEFEDEGITVYRRPPEEKS